MDEQLTDEFDRERQIRRAKRIEEMKRRKRRQLLFRRIVALGILILVVAAVLLFLGTKIAGLFSKEGQNNSEIHIETEGDNLEGTTQTQVNELDQNHLEDNEEDKESVKEQETAEEKPVYFAQATSDTRQPGEDIISSNVILIDEDAQIILMQRNADEIICPASMTKILTVLVAAEHVTDLDDTFTITLDITDYSFVHDCSNAGFARDETVTVRDLFYGTVLPSGADAAVALATYVAGSQEAFVEMMNEKIKELGLSETAHFTNCVGIYEEDHYCTVYDMAMMLKAAMDNELCREVLSTHTYTTSATDEHPEGITISNWFLRRIEDKDCGGEVLGGKTGYVVESGNCAASYALDADQKGYICVTADAHSGWRCIYDQVALYK